MPQRVPIGELLLKLGRIDPMQLQSALAHQRQWGGRLGRALVGPGVGTRAGRASRSRAGFARAPAQPLQSTRGSDSPVTDQP